MFFTFPLFQKMWRKLSILSSKQNSENFRLLPCRNGHNETWHFERVHNNYKEEVSDSTPDDRPCTHHYFDIVPKLQPSRNIQKMPSTAPGSPKRGGKKSIPPSTSPEMVLEDIRCRLRHSLLHNSELSKKARPHASTKGNKRTSATSARLCSTICSYINRVWTASCPVLGSYFKSIFMNVSFTFQNLQTLTIVLLGSREPKWDSTTWIGQQKRYTVMYRARDLRGGFILHD